MRCPLGKSATGPDPTRQNPKALRRKALHRPQADPEWPAPPNPSPSQHQQQQRDSTPQIHPAASFRCCFPGPAPPSVSPTFSLIILALPTREGSGLRRRKVQPNSLVSTSLFLTPVQVSPPLRQGLSEPRFLVVVAGPARLPGAPLLSWSILVEHH